MILNNARVEREPLQILIMHSEPFFIAIRTRYSIMEISISYTRWACEFSISGVGKQNEI